MFWVVWNKDRSEGFITNDVDDAFQASTGQFDSIRSSIGESFFEAYGDEIEKTNSALEIQEIGAIIVDAAVQIGEEAFRAGFQAAAQFAEGNLVMNPDTPLSSRAAEALERAWSEYEPSEAVKELTA